MLKVHLIKKKFFSIKKCVLDSHFSTLWSSSFVSAARAGLTLLGLVVAGPGQAAERSPTGRGWAWVFKAAGETVVVVEACAPHFCVSAAQLVPQWLSLAEANTTGGGKG